MKYPTLPVQYATRDTIDVFRGYNHNLRIEDGEFYNMQNMTSDLFPVLSPRKARGLFSEPYSPQGLIAKDQLCWVDGSDFVLGGTRINMNLSTDASMCPKQLISMGAYVIILPDKQYINTADTSDRGFLEYNESSTGVFLCASDEYGSWSLAGFANSGDTPPDPEDRVWLDTSVTPNVLKRYDVFTKQWVAVVFNKTILLYNQANEGTYGMDWSGISVGDSVTVSGLLDEQIQYLNGTWEVVDKGFYGDSNQFAYIVVDCYGGCEEYLDFQDTPWTVSRLLPRMDIVIESENRLWGCRYGENLAGETVNEIYASKLGDFRNWNSFQGISTDSYVASCGSDGPFTGAVNHLGYPLFFKENCLHKVYGSYPANYQVTTTACRGVQKGCQQSLAIVNQVLYYKARGCVCAYDGSLPVDVSEALGNTAYSDAVAGGAANKYYISMADDDGNWNLFVYDTAKRMWHREDSLRADAMCSWMGELYCISHNDRKILALQGSGTAFEDNVDWAVQTGEIGITTPDMKYISRMVIRLSMDKGSVVRFYGKYDMEDEWEELVVIRSDRLRSFPVPIRPRRCDHMTLRMEGTGSVRIYSITKTIEQGSDRSR